MATRRQKGYTGAKTDVALLFANGTVGVCALLNLIAKMLLPLRCARCNILRTNWPTWSRLGVLLFNCGKPAVVALAGMLQPFSAMTTPTARIIEFNRLNDATVAHQCRLLIGVLFSHTTGVALSVFSLTYVSVLCHRRFESMQGLRRHVFSFSTG